jgi:hypothetical protein
VLLLRGGSLRSMPMGLTGSGGMQLPSGLAISLRFLRGALMESAWNRLQNEPCPMCAKWKNQRRAAMATTKGMTEKLKKQVKSANMKRANAFSQKAKIDKKNKSR